MSNSSFRARPRRRDVGAALILGLLAQGLAMVHGRLSAATTFDFYQLHKSLGFAALAVTAARLVARILCAAPKPLASPLWERRLAAHVQALLYALTLAAILSGWLVVSASPLPVPTRFFGLFVIPNLGGQNPALFAGAALTHHFIERDDALIRMLRR